MTLSFTVTYDADRWNPTDMCEAAVEKNTDTDVHSSPKRMHSSNE